MVYNGIESPYPHSTYIKELILHLQEKIPDYVETVMTYAEEL